MTWRRALRFKFVLEVILARSRHLFPPFLRHVFGHLDVFREVCSKDDIEFSAAPILGALVALKEPILVAAYSDMWCRLTYRSDVASPTK